MAKRQGRQDYSLELLAWFSPGCSCGVGGGLVCSAVCGLCRKVPPGSLGPWERSRGRGWLGGRRPGGPGHSIVVQSQALGRLGEPFSWRRQLWEAEPGGAVRPSSASSLRGWTPVYTVPGRPDGNLWCGGKNFSPRFQPAGRENNISHRGDVQKLLTNRWAAFSQ